VEGTGQGTLCTKKWYTGSGPVISCTAMFETNHDLLEHIAGHDSNVKLIQKRSRKKSKSSSEDTSLSQDQDQDQDQDRSLDIANLDERDEAGTICAGGIYFDADDDIDNDFDENDLDEVCDEDNDDDVYFIGHVRGGKRKRARTLSVSSDHSPIVPVDKLFQCPHDGCGRSFTQVCSKC
jgi:hypothetical protein